MPTKQEYAAQPLTERLERLARTPRELAASIGGQGDTLLSRRPDPKSWAPKAVFTD